MTTPIPQAGQRFVNNFSGRTVTVTSVDLQTGRVHFIYVVGPSVSTTFGDFYSGFSSELPAGSQPLLADVAGAGQVLSFLPNCLIDVAGEIIKRTGSATRAVSTPSPKCECGLDATGSGGNHSSYCPKAELERA